MDEELIAGHLQELRRGTVVLACLVTLAEPRYGYALLETLSEAGFAVDGNTLYPLLRRLEKQGVAITRLPQTGERGQHDGPPPDLLAVRSQHLLDVHNRHASVCHTVLSRAHHCSTPGAGALGRA